MPHFHLLLAFISFELSNLYVIWVLMELLFMSFLLIGSKMGKDFGSVIYFSFQSIISLALLIIFFSYTNLIFFIMMVKSGLFPSHFWMVTVCSKANLFLVGMVLGVQKLVLRWVLVILSSSFTIYSVMLLYIFSNLFLLLSLLYFNDFWSMLVHTSVANIGMILLAGSSSYFVFIFCFYNFVIMFSGILSFYINNDHSYISIILFIAVPRFLLSLMKIMVAYGSLLNVNLFLFLIEVVSLMIYFSVYSSLWVALEDNFILITVFLLITTMMPMGGNFDTMILFY